MIVRMLGDRMFPSLLEVGTGSGVFLPELSKHCEKLYACDIHHNFDHIHRLLRMYDVSNYELSSQDIEKTTYPDHSFDAIVAVSVLEFIGNIDAAIAEIRRILKDDGVFVTICPMESKLLDKVIAMYSRKKPEEEFGNSRKFVTKMLEENFIFVEKGYLTPIIGRYFPIYTHYKLRK
jgi:ubiquinone/menaquinone biosynthesis C-methylase UbiE